MKHKISKTAFHKYFRNDLRKSINEYFDNPEQFVREYSLIINGKRRKIITYQSNDKGRILRDFHAHVNAVLRWYHNPLAVSFAYIVNRNSVACLHEHLSSNIFLKTDIHSYFDSVLFDLLLKRFLCCIKANSREKTYWTSVLKACFYCDKLPFGFITSPILSDLYLHDIDEKYGARNDIHYTRYADDIIVSSSEENSVQMLSNIKDSIKADLQLFGLEINNRKTYIRQLTQKGDAIHLLGLNIVKTASDRNEITVSDKYLRETSKELCILISKKDQMNNWESAKRFFAVMGKIAYIVHSSSRSSAKFQRMIFVKTGLQLNLDFYSLAKVCLKDISIIEAYKKRKTFAVGKDNAKNCLPLLTTDMEVLEKRPEWTGHMEIIADWRMDTESKIDSQIWTCVKNLSDYCFDDWADNGGPHSVLWSTIININAIEAKEFTDLLLELSSLVIQAEGEISLAARFDPSPEMGKHSESEAEYVLLKINKIGKLEVKATSNFFS